MKGSFLLHCIVLNIKIIVVPKTITTSTYIVLIISQITILSASMSVNSTTWKVSGLQNQCLQFCYFETQKDSQSPAIFGYHFSLHKSRAVKVQVKPS